MNSKELEDLQERAEANEARARQLRAVSRSRRQYITHLPKRLLTLSKVTAPGTPYAIAGDFTCSGLPRQWVGGEFVTRLEVRQSR